MKRILYALSFLRHAFIIIVEFLYHPQKKRIVIVATPTHGNLGDQAIVYAEKKMLKKICKSHVIIEIENGGFLKCKNLISKLVRPTDLIVIDGGGNLGTLWPWEDDKISNIIASFKENKIIVFPQTAFYDDTLSSDVRIKRNRQVYNECKDLTILLRDRASYNCFIRNFPRIKSILCPDIVLSLDIEQNFARRGVILCFRNDREKVFANDAIQILHDFLNRNYSTVVESNTVISTTVRRLNREKELNKKWVEFSSTSLVITDRLHGMIFAFITGTPCIAINNKSKKVEGCFEFLEKCNYIKMASTINEVVHSIPEVINIRNEEKGFRYPTDILIRCIHNDEEE